LEANSSPVYWFVYNDPNTVTPWDDADEGYAYQYDKGTGEFEELNVDFFLRYVFLLPITGAFQDYNLRVNGTLVDDDGVWESTDLFSSDPVVLNVTANWLLKFNVTCESFHVRNGILTTEFYVHADFDNSTWYVKSNYTYPSELSNASTRFYVPSDWQLVNASNIISRVGNLIMVNSTNPWALNFNGTNYVSSIVHPANITINNEIEFSTQWNTAVTVSNGNLTMAIYNTTNEKIYEETKNVTEGGNFTWTPQNVEKGEYKVAVLFYNGTEIGYRISTFQVLYTMKVEVEPLDEYYFVGKNVTIRVRCIDNITRENITDANVQATWTKGTVPFTYNSTSRWYEGIFDTSGLKAGKYNVSIQVTKEYYVKTVKNVTLNLIYPTEVQPKTKIYKINYTDSINLTIQYTYSNGTPIRDANVYTDEFTFSFNGTTYIYEYKPQEIGNFTFIVHCEKPLHQSQNATIKIEVYVASTEVKCSWTEIEIEYLEETQLNIRYESNGKGVANATCTVTYTLVNGTLRTQIYQTNESGYVALNISSKIFADNIEKNNVTGQHIINIKLQKYGYESQEVNVTVTIIPLSTTLKIRINGENVTFYIVEYPSPINISLIFQDEHGNPVNNATIKECIIEMINGSKKTIPLIEKGNGLYTVILSPDEFNPYPQPKSVIGNRTINLKLSKCGYKEKETTITINIIPGETNIEVLYPENIEAGSLFAILVNYTDKEGETLSYFNGALKLDNTTITTFNETQIPLNLTTYVGTYNITITVTHLNYKNQTWKGIITIYGKIKATCIPEHFEEYENETITIRFYIEDLYRKTPIENCNITLKLNEHEWFMIWSSQNSSFTLNLMGIEPGNYIITVSIKASNYVPENIQIPLHVLPKTYVILTVNVPKEVTAGETLLISGTLTTENGTPVAMATIKIILEVTYENGTTKEYKYETVTNLKGEFTHTFQTTKEMTNITITIIYEGTREKAATTGNYNITVKSPTIFTKLLHSWWAFALAVSVASAFTGTHKYISKRKQKAKIEQEKLVREYELILELDSLESLLVVEKESGLCLFEYPFKGTTINSDLVAGFIQAIRSFYVEIGGMGEGEVGEIYYEMPEPKVLTFHSGKHTYAILIAPGKLLPEVKESLRNFLDKFEEEFKGLLEKGNTNITIYSLAKEYIKECFPQQLLTKYTVPQKLPKTRGIKRKILRTAKKLAEEQGPFTMAQLLTEVAKKEKIDPLKALKALKELINQKIIQPIQEKPENKLQ